jgi:hypothetical protein
MKDLWRKTWELLRDNPILWIPCPCANLLAICLWRLRGMAEKAIFRRFLTGHSVLGGDTWLRPDRAMLAKASMVYAPVGFATIFAVVFVFVAALVVTAKMVKAIGSGQGPMLRVLWAEAVPCWRRILLFSVKFLVACGVFLAVAFFLATSLFGSALNRDLANSAIFIQLGALTLACCLVLLLAPAAIRLLQVKPKGNIPWSTCGQAVVFAAVASEAGILLGMFAQKLESGIVFDYKWELAMLSALNSLVANAPYALLFIALALLALENDGNAADETDPDSLALAQDSPTR